MGLSTHSRPVGDAFEACGEGVDAGDVYGAAWGHALPERRRRRVVFAAPFASSGFSIAYRIRHGVVGGLLPISRAREPAGRSRRCLRPVEPSGKARLVTPNVGASVFGHLPRISALNYSVETVRN